MTLKLGVGREDLVKRPSGHPLEVDALGFELMPVFFECGLLPFDEVVRREVDVLLRGGGTCLAPEEVD